MGHLLFFSFPGSAVAAALWSGCSRLLLVLYFIGQVRLAGSWGPQAWWGMTVSLDVKQ